MKSDSALLLWLAQQLQYEQRCQVVEEVLRFEMEETVLLLSNAYERSLRQMKAQSSAGGILHPPEGNLEAERVRRSNGSQLLIAGYDEERHVGHRPDGRETPTGLGTPKELQVCFHRLHPLRLIALLTNSVIYLISNRWRKSEL